MFKEIAFLAAPVSLGVVGASVCPWIIERWFGPWEQASVYSTLLVPPVNVPLWLAVASGVLMGYLIGAGVVWGVRIFASLAFGKEALGLGDVHLVAAIGACLGWVDGLLGFFGAAFVGLAWTVAGWAMGGRVNRTLPYGPYIAIASVLVLLGKPGAEWILQKVTGMAINLP
jgi:prepilin signal peptidase PulO-like enzyme (type II secretory pathway)